MLRPVRAEDLLDDRESASDYLAAVEDYVAAFNAAEADAMRRRRNDFPEPDSSELSLLSGFSVWPRMRLRHRTNVNVLTIWRARSSRV